MSVETVPGTAFQHVVYRRGAGPSRTLHVYVDGDGTPWRGRVAQSDPTPRNPFMVDLMALDAAPSVYLGRPCYHGQAATPPCSVALWTAERYSAAVVSSMTAALRRIVGAGGVERIVLVGYSGGGVLAFLLASEVPETTDLVTVAANLDIDAWADLHDFTRLAGSVNPARRPPLPPAIRQRHYVGGRDQVVPRAVTARGPIPPDSIVEIRGYDHVCCWKDLWPRVLASIPP